MAAQQFLPAEFTGFLYFGSRNIELHLKDLNQAFRENLLVRESHKGTDILDIAVIDLLNIILDILRIGHDDRAVVVILRAFRLLTLVEDAGIEDRLNALIQQPLHMAVCQLGRITLGFTRDGFHSKLVDLAGG